MEYLDNISRKNLLPTRQKVQQIFNSIADKYDRANRAITLGMDKGWRKKLVAWSEPPKPCKILDCATGTGALAFEFQTYLGPSARITGVDFCENMLKKAQELVQKGVITKKPSMEPRPKQVDDEHPKHIHFQQGDVQNLPFPDNTFDVSAMAYGLRNMTDPVQALKEMARVTRSGGKVMILETGNKPFWPLYPCFYLYFRYIVPFLGGWITGQKSAYQYLQESSKNFPSRGQFLKILQNTGAFSQCEYQILFFGASFIYKAVVV